MAQQLIISDTSADYDQFRENFNTYLRQKESWKGNLTTMTGQTLIDLVSALGAFDQAKISRAYQDAFAETAVSDEAIRACAVMQGIRMTRKTPAQIQAQLTGPKGLVIPEYSQIDCAGYSFFNREAIEFLEGDGDGVTKTVTLYQGEINIYDLTGNGEDLQVWVSTEDNFAVSDSDVQVKVNDETIPISYSGLWNFKNKPACMDLTTSNGRLIIQFGTAGIKNNGTSLSDLPDLEPDLIETPTYGTIPGINDKVEITYVITAGESGNNYVTLGKTLTLDGYDAVEGVAMSNPNYGANEKSTLTYKNNTASSFGTYGSAVTKSQYSEIVNGYPGVIDAVTQAQREINPGNLKYMNVIWVTGITNETWNETQKQAFCEYCQKLSMYSTRFVWIDATKINREVAIKCFCYNSAVLSEVEDNVKKAILKLFEPRPGILMLNIFRSDIIDAALSSDPNISYVILEEPTYDFIVTRANAPSLTYTLNADAGTPLTRLQYAYCVTFVDEDGNESLKDNWVHPVITEDGMSITLTWYNEPSAVQYKVYGRLSESVGLMKTLDAGTTTFTDDGTITPDESEFEIGTSTEFKYNAVDSLTGLTVTAEYTDRQQRLMNSLPYRAS